MFERSLIGISWPVNQKIEENFPAYEFLAQHPEYDWQKPLLRDMKACPWTTFTAGQRPAE